MISRIKAPSQHESATCPTRRAGFTLVELLVVMALITLIMSILSQAFVEGLETVRTLKAINDLQESLRTAVVPLRDDLLSRHFTGSEKLGISYTSAGVRPTTGFFRIQQGVAHEPNLAMGIPGLIEGSDSDGLPSYRVAVAPLTPTSANYQQWSDVLHMTISKVGYRRTDYMTALAPTVPGADQLWAVPPAPPALPAPPAAEPYDYRLAGTYISQWAEVMWFLSPMVDSDTGLQMTAGKGNIPLFNLHRRQKLLLTVNETTLNGLASGSRIASSNIGLFPEIACRPDTMNSQAGSLYFTTPTGSIVPANRSMMDAAGQTSYPHPRGTPYPIGSAGALVAGAQEDPVTRADDRIITDVISFEVKVLMPGQVQFQDIRTVQMNLGLAQDGIYDTATWAGSQLTIKAIQVVIRVWDQRTELTRQITMIQDM